MSDSDKKNRRRLINLNIKRQMQMRLIMKIMLIVIICILLSSSIFYIFSNQAIGQTWNAFHLKLHNMKQLLLPIVILATLMSIIVAVFMGIFFPNPFVGPIYRIERTIQSLSEGNLNQKIILRQKDEITDLASYVNCMSDKFREKILDLKDNIIKIAKLAEENNNEELVGEVKKLEENINWFKS